MFGARIVPTQLPSVLVALFANGLTGFDQLLNVLQSVLLPFAILPVLKLTANRRVMGEFRTHLFWFVPLPRSLFARKLTRAMCRSIVTWVIGIFVIAINIYLTLQILPDTTPWRVGAGIGGVLYVIFCLYLAVYDFVEAPLWKLWLRLRTRQRARQKAVSEHLIN